MKTINLKQLDIKRVASGIIQNNFNRKEIPKNPFGLTNSNLFRRSNKNTKNYKNKVKTNVSREEEKSDMNLFNKTYSNKTMLSRLPPKDNLLGINNVKTGANFNQKFQKNFPRNFSSHNISKDSTLYKTKNRLLSSLKLEKLKNKYKNKSMIITQNRKSSFNSKNFRALSASAKNINGQNYFKKKYGSMDNTKIIGHGGFITALDPALQQNQIRFTKSSDKIDNRSYLMRKLGGEKKYLSYFDIQRILYFDKNVYKPDVEFEKKIYDLKKNNSDAFISHFNLDNYKKTILFLFQKHVSTRSFDIMKKNFEKINKAWKQRSRSTTRPKKVTKIQTSQTERELIYNQLKKEREERIREKYSKKKKK